MLPLGNAAFMKFRILITHFFAWLMLFVAVNTSVAQEEEVEADAQEIGMAQETARRFVSRMQHTRDVAALFDELFLPNFISHLVSEEGLPPILYSRLTNTERQRFFVVQWNLNYLSSIAIISEHDDMGIVTGERKSNSRMLLPYSVALKLRRALKSGGTELKSYKQFRAFLPAMEKSLAEARFYLKRRGMEQTPGFQKKLNPRDELGSSIYYRVRVYIGGENVKDCEPLVGFPKSQKFFRVELPLLIGAILVKDGNRMRIVRLTIVDGD